MEALEMSLIKLVNEMSKRGIDYSDAWHIVQNEWDFIEEYFKKEGTKFSSIKKLSKTLLSIYMVA